MSATVKNKYQVNPKTIITSVMAFVIPLALIWVINQFWVLNYYVPSASMETTLLTNDRIFGAAINASEDNISRGEMVVFKDTQGWMKNSEEGEAFLVKRVIGLPGDVISCCDEDGNLLINGEPYVEDYIPFSSNVPFAPQTVPEGHIFVLGDNREYSADSRAHIASGTQFVPFEDVESKVFFIHWPLSRFGPVE